LIDESDSPTVIAALKPLYVEDFEERARWKQAAAELASPAIGVEILELASRKLRAGGGVLAQLRAQRAALDAMIEKLERVHVGV
jgi:hypothetical protein